MKEIFVKAIDTIENREKRNFALYLTGLIPSYFWTIPASSSGKYHPITDLGEGGLVRHSLMVYRVALDLLESKQDTTIDRDDIIIAALFHDCCKQGYKENGQKTEFEMLIHEADYIASRKYVLYDKDFFDNL